MKIRFVQHSIIKTTLAGLAATVTLLAAAPAYAGTGWAHGANWASNGGLPGQPYDNSVLYPEGLTQGMTDAQAQAEADKVANDLEGIGVNFVRFPVDPATVNGNGSFGPNWSTDQAAINELIADGMTVDICCFYTDWQGTGQIPNMATWQTMWQTVDGVYSGNNNVYYEAINEPFGYTLSGLESVYTTFLGFIHKSQSHIILGGTGYEDNVTGIGGDSSLSSCLLGLHDYAFWDTNRTTESAWETQLQGAVGSYSGRTIMTEFGAEASTGLNYSRTTSDYNISFIRGMCIQIRSWGMGACYFPAYGNSKHLFNSPGGGIVNQSLVNQLQYGWNVQFAGVAFGAAVINSLDTPEIAGVDTSGNVNHKWIQTDGTWANWTSLGSPSGGAKQWGAIMGIDTDGSLEVFVTGASDGAVYNSFESSNGWTAFSSLGGSGGNLSSPAAIIDNDGRMNLFVVGSDNAIWWNKQTVPGGSWMGWTQMSGTHAKSGEAPTAILNYNQNGDGSMEVIYNNTGNSAVSHFFQTTAGGSDWSWSGEQSLGGGANLSGLSASRNSDGRLDVSVVGSDNKVWHNWQTTAGGGWNGWAHFDTSQSAVSSQAPCLTVNQSGKLEIFMNSTNGHVYHNWQTTAGGSWNGWADMGGGGNNLTRFWGITQDSGDLEVFVVGGNNAVWTDSQTSPGGSWAGWSSLSNPAEGGFTSW